MHLISFLRDYFKYNKKVKLCLVVIINKYIIILLINTIKKIKK